MTNIKDYNFGPKEEFDLDNLDLDNIELDSVDDFIVFLHKMEDLDVNITFNSISEDTDLIMRIFEDEDNKDKAPLVWIYKIEEELADEDPDEWHLEYLTSKVIDRYVEKYGYKQFIELIEEYPKLKELLFINSMHASYKLIAQFIKNNEDKAFCYYMDIICNNEKIFANNDTDGYEYFIKMIALYMFYAADEKYSFYADMIRSYSKEISELSKAVMEYYLLDNNPAIDRKDKLPGYEKYLAIMVSLFNDEDEDPGLINESAIRDCRDKIERIKSDEEDNEDNDTYKPVYITEDDFDDNDFDEFHDEYDDDDLDDWRERDVSRYVFDDDGFGGEEMYNYDGELMDY